MAHCDWHCYAVVAVLHWAMAIPLKKVDNCVRTTALLISSAGRPVVTIFGGRSISLVHFSEHVSFPLKDAPPSAQHVSHFTMAITSLPAGVVVLL